MSIRYYKSGDDKNIVELLKKTFPKWAAFNNSLDLWRWKYINTPLKTVITVAVADKKIVGCDHAHVLNAKLGPIVTTLGYTDDLAVDSEFRGLGLWRKMQSLKYETFTTLTKYRYSTTMNPVILKSWAKSNRPFLPFPVTRMVKTKDINLQLKETPMKNKYLVKLGYIALKVINWVNNLFKPPIKKLSRFQIKQINEFDNKIDFFWMKIKDDYSFIIEKKQEYLNWRFIDNDRGNHVKFLAVDGEEVLGYMVVGFKPGSSEGHVEDLLALKDRADVADALFEHACNYLDELGLNTMFYQVVVGHPYQKISARYGFLDSRSRPTISIDYTVYGTEKREVPFLVDITRDQVYFNYADTL